MNDQNTTFNMSNINPDNIKISLNLSLETEQMLLEQQIPRSQKLKLSWKVIKFIDDQLHL